MAPYVLLTVFLFQRGSSESKDPDATRSPWTLIPRRPTRGSRFPGRFGAGGIVLVLYEHSLTLALFGIFAASFALHAVPVRRIQRGTAAPWGSSGVGDRIPRHGALLVRVVPELAERIPGRWGVDRPVDRSATARLARVQACCREPRRNRVLTSTLEQRQRPEPARTEAAAIPTHRSFLLPREAGDG